MSSCRRTVVFAALAFAGLSLVGRPANATLNYYIYQSGGDVILEASGSLAALPAVIGTGACPAASGLYEIQQTPVPALRLCTGIAQSLNIYPIALQIPSPLATLPVGLVAANSGTPIATAINSEVGSPSGNFFLSAAYVPGSPVASRSTFSNRTLATDFGITGTGVVGIWTLNGTSETINLIAGPPVPGPLPLLGGGAAFAWSRRLRGRVKGRPMVEVDPGTHVQAD